MIYTPILFFLYKIRKYKYSLEIVGLFIFINGILISEYDLYPWQTDFGKYLCFLLGLSLKI